MLNALSVALDGCNEAGWLRSARSFQRQGFVAAENSAWPGGRITAWSHPTQQGAPNHHVRTGDGMACSIGPLWYRGRFGVDALTTLLAEAREGGRVDESALRGNFVLFLHAGDKVWLLNDALGFVRVYISADGCFFSTSWLAACAYLDHVELDAASVIEYVLLGAAHSRRSVARNVDLLPLGRAVDMGRKRTWQRFDVAADDSPFGSSEEAIDVIAGHLRKVFAEIAAAFPSHVNAALSGGFDSRLIVAALLASGVRPRLFVYGSSHAPDVVVARALADFAGIALDVIDKEAINRGMSPPDPESLEQTALFFDGLPNDGIFDPGADRETRLRQTAAGCIALNGGGGEIFRNFFHLPDRSFSPRDVVRAFYRGFDPRVFRDARRLPGYEERLAAAMLALPGLSSDANGRLTRSQVELLYPLFRCHYWMGANNSVGVRHGHYATPLVDLELVRLSRRLPLRWKNAGAFQGRLVAELHPGIAAQPSAYGFSFTAGPNWRARLGEWSNRARPVWLRPLINATRRRLHNVCVSPDTLQRYRAMLPGEWRLDPLLDLRLLPDDNALRRALAVEVVWRRVL